MTHSLGRPSKNLLDIDRIESIDISHAVVDCLRPRQVGDGAQLLVDARNTNF